MQIKPIIIHGGASLLNILYYNWYENSEYDFCNTMVTLGHTVAKINYQIKDFEKDESFSAYLLNLITSYQFDCIFTFNYFPIISKTAEEHRIKYVSWIYDNPHFTLYSATISNTCNYIFAFDHTITNDLKQRGALHAFHMPLAVNTKRLGQLLGTNFNHIQYQSDISFVGTLYENNLYDQITFLPDYLKGYFNAIFDIQHNFYNCNLIGESLTDSIINELSQYVHTDYPAGIHIPPKFFYQCMLMGKLTNIERIHYLSLLSEKYTIDLYTGSPKTLLPQAQIKHHGYISYNTKMPEIFRTSKINLNITLRSIQSGIPLRAIDILGCGGFLLSNDQEELAKNFIDGKEIVLFENDSDLSEKTDYYLSHENERMDITINGYQKAALLYNYETSLNKIFSLCGLT